MNCKTLPALLLLLPLFACGHGEHDNAHTDDIAALAPTLGDVTIKVEGDYRVIESRALPSHETGDFPNRGNPHTISAQSFRFTVPLTPHRLKKPIRYDGYEFGVAINGVPLDPGTGEFWRGQPNWREEAILADGEKKLGVDQSNAHVQPSGKYHYHGVPWGLINELRKDNPKAGVDSPLLIGWAADGYPIYFLEGVRSSWLLKKGERPSSPEGPGGEYDGQYTTDYGFNLESGYLDWLNGHYGKTAEYPEGIYQYYVTEDFPYVPRYFLGEPDDSFRKQHAHGGGRPGAGDQRMGPGGQRPPPSQGRGPN